MVADFINGLLSKASLLEISEPGFIEPYSSLVNSSVASTPVPAAPIDVHDEINEK
jgi:hypothetical protein